MTTNLAFSEWTQLFENATMVAALVDRLTYRSYVLDIPLFMADQTERLIGVARKRKIQSNILDSSYDKL